MKDALTEDSPPLSLHTVGQLYRGHHRWLVGWLRRRLGCPHNAADLAQDTFARVLVRRDALTWHADPGGGKALLSTIAHGLMVDHLRRAALERAFLDALSALPADQAPSVEEQQLMLQTLVEVDAVLRDLPTKVRQAFLLSQIDGLPYGQIAQELGVSLSSVQQYMTRAFGACAELNDFSRRIKTLPPALARGTLAATPPASPGSPAPATATVPSARSTRSERPASGRRAMLKGVVLLAGTAGIGLATSPDGGLHGLMASHRTGVGERRRVVLADGSVLQLNTSTALDARVDAHTRCVKLFAGEVLIDCAKDGGSASSMPLDVLTAQGRMRTASGRFIVRQLADRTSVQALAGWIDVQPGGDASAHRRIGPGQQWVFDARGGGVVEPIDSAAGAWIDGLVVARDMPLAELVAELSRYRRGWLRCDEAVARLRISGVFPTHDLDRVVAALQRTLPVRARARTAWWVTLERR